MCVPVVFLDRDGTLNVDTGYPCSPDEVVLVPGAGNAVARLKSAGFIVVVVSNQSAVGRGIASLSDVEATNQKLEELLCRENSLALIDEVLFCPHHPDDGCNCRKPRTGLLEAKSGEWDFCAEDSWIIGDKLSDVEFGTNLGIPKGQRLLIPGAACDERQEMVMREICEAVDAVRCGGLSEAVDVILKHSRAGRR